MACSGRKYYYSVMRQDAVAGITFRRFRIIHTIFTIPFMYIHVLILYIDHELYTKDAAAAFNDIYRRRSAMIYAFIARHFCHLVAMYVTLLTIRRATIRACWPQKRPPFNASHAATFGCAKRRRAGAVRAALPPRAATPSHGRHQPARRPAAAHLLPPFCRREVFASSLSTVSHFLLQPIIISIGHAMHR